MTTFLHSILQQNKFNSINVKFKFRILEALLMDHIMDSINMEKKMIISVSSRKFSTFTPEIWILHPSIVIPCLLVDRFHKNKIRTNEPEIHWKNNWASARIIWLLFKKSVNQNRDNCLKLSFMNIWDLILHFIGCESFLESNLLYVRQT